MVFEEIRAALQEDGTLDAVRNKAQEGLDGCSMAAGLLLKDGKVFVPDISSWAQAVIAAAHEVGHEGIQKTLRTVWADFCNSTRQCLLYMPTSGGATGYAGYAPAYPVIPCTKQVCIHIYIKKKREGTHLRLGGTAQLHELVADREREACRD
jgi:hypothetical protein